MSYEHDGAGVFSQKFQDIIAERKAEVRQTAVLKRLQNLKRIQDMKSKTGVHPLTIFPQEIWQLIFNELSPEDRGNVWQVHHVFRDIMQTFRIRDILFPQILKFEVKTFGRNERGQMREYAVPLAHDLELRRVSKSLRNAVDHYLKEDLQDCYALRDLDRKPGKCKVLQFDRNTVENIESLDRLCSDVRSNSKSFRRLPSKSLSIQMRELNDTDPDFLQRFQELKEKLLCFLSLVGDQLFHFEFMSSHFENIENGIDQVYIAFVQCISLMPNLQWLQVSLRCQGRDGYCACRCDFQSLRKFPLQPLPSLRRIDLGNEGEPCWEVRTNSFYRAILEANPHIIHLIMLRELDVLPREKSLQLETFAHREPYMFGCDGYDDNNFFIQEKTVDCSWPLKRLKLLISLDGDSIISVFKFLLKFPSLEQVTLEIHDVKIGGGIDFLMLPNLTEFDLKLSSTNVYNAPTHFFFSLQFLLHCKHLQKLKWKSTKKCGNDEMNGERPENMIQFNARGLKDFRGRRSNIWRVFPHLQCVQVNRRCWYRW